ncbi:hypothetical protein OF829_04085 [Sphingomonas sp. LB-2]|uniref:hypothetical protein n=1 Tax=Sphingomonas caeni TaxID=2984949 RepID=UPI002231BA27|nr:hypothetical protein [Sphingomonas caeni]MCW3846408.1 hypothetical protein [Sphingomonas caeni]
MARMIGTAALWLMALAAPAQAQSAPRWIPEAGTHSYRYESITHIPNAPGQSFRLDYDLISDGKGGLVAVIKAAGHRDRDAGEWSDPEIDDACRTALHAQGSELARVTLSPIAPDVAQSLGSAFMPDCAPPDIFFPITDVLNVALIQVAPQFQIAQLAKPGDSRRFPGYKTNIDRPDTVVGLESTGGTISFASLVPGRASIDWASDPLKISLIHRRAYNGADVTLTGTEMFVFRLEIDPRTGVLLSAATVSDQLDMTMSLPGGYSQPLPITREVSIKPLP